MCQHRDVVSVTTAVKIRLYTQMAVSSLNREMQVLKVLKCKVRVLFYTTCVYLHCSADTYMAKGGMCGWVLEKPDLNESK